MRCRKRTSRHYALEENFKKKKAARREILKRIKRQFVGRKAGKYSLQLQLDVCL